MQSRLALLMNLLLSPPAINMLECYVTKLTKKKKNFQKQETSPALIVDGVEELRNYAADVTLVAELGSLDYPSYALWRHRLSHTSSSECSVFHCDGN